LQSSSLEKASRILIQMMGQINNSGNLLPSPLGSIEPAPMRELID
jgi:hypothetical protein